MSTSDRQVAADAENHRNSDGTAVAWIARGEKMHACYFPNRNADSNRDGNRRGFGDFCGILEKLKKRFQETFIEIKYPNS